MKYTGIAIPFLFIAFAGNAAVVYNKDSNKLDVYGKISPRHYLSSNPSQDGDKTYVRFGIRGETQISDRLTGYSRWEYEFKGNNPESTNQGDKTRYAYAGLRDAYYGSIDYGRSLGILYDVASWTDMLPEFGSDTWSQNDVYMAKRTTGLLTWRTTDFLNLVEDLSFGLQYQGKNEAGRTDIRKQNGDGWGSSISYKLSDVSLGLTYASSNRTTEQKNSPNKLNATGNRAEAWGTGLKYDNGKVYASAVYSTTYNMTTFGNYISNKANNFESVIQYQFDNGIKPSLGYLRSKASDIAGYGSKDIVEYLSVGGFYYFTKNVSAIIDYKVNLLKEESFTRKVGINTDDVVGLGFTYAF